MVFLCIFPSPNTWFLFSSSWRRPSVNTILSLQWFRPHNFHLLCIFLLVFPCAKKVSWKGKNKWEGDTQEFNFIYKFSECFMVWENLRDWDWDVFSQLRSVLLKQRSYSKVVLVFLFLLSLHWLIISCLSFWSDLRWISVHFFHMKFLSSLSHFSFDWAIEGFICFIDSWGKEKINLIFQSV